jgi:exosome complex exonuclease RRP6
MWKDDIDNSTNPFVPRIRVKPNALVPLASSIINEKLEESTIQDASLREHVTGTMGVPLRSEGFPHPYQYELTHLGYEKWMLDSRPEQIYGKMEETPITFVNTEEALLKMARTLENVKEIAIDLEAHQYRSFQGFTCLMQISTRREDFIVDTLALRRSMHVLNSSFTNPAIVKVIHGSDGDILWLQRDFGLYIVNLFDTGQAARVLEYPSYALSYLLKFFCSITADKRFQKADWRIRPLPDEMFKYAREDTHFLLYIYDKMRNESISRAAGSTELLQAILNRSKDLCLQRYEKEACTPTSYLELLSKFGGTALDAQQTEVFAAVFNWRDATCRLEDESTRYVLPNHMILQIADKMPEDDKGLQSACVPVPPLVKMNLPELLKVIRQAKARGAIHLQQQQQQQSSTGAPSTTSSSSSSRLADTTLNVTSSEELARQAGWLTDSSSSFGLGHEITSGPISTGGLFVSSGSTSSFLDSNPGITLDSFTSADSDLDSKATADAIRSSFNVSSWMPSSAHLLSEESLDSSSSAGILQASSSSLDPQRSATAATSDAGLFDGIPKSMQEIYQLSNQTKRNKKKRDAADSDPSQASDVLGSPQSPFFLQDGEGSLDIRAAKRAKTTDADSDKADLLSDIGWASGTPSKLPPGASKPQQQDAPSGSSSSSSFTSYDYSKHKEARPAPGPAQQSAARGQVGEASLNPFGHSTANRPSKDSKTGGDGHPSGNGGGHHHQRGGSNHRGGGRGRGRGSGAGH